MTEFYNQWTKQGNIVTLEKHTRYLDIRDNIGASPMHYAASMGHFHIIRLIVQITGQQGTQNHTFTHVLVWISLNKWHNMNVKYCCKETTNLIVDTAELNVRDEEGNTPLHWAVQKDQPGSCSVLLTMGADPNILNNSQLSPLHMAVSLGKNVVLEVGQPAHSITQYYHYITASCPFLCFSLEAIYLASQCT